MHKGRFVKKKKLNVPVLVILILLAVMALVFGILLGRSNGAYPFETEGTHVGPSTALEQTDASTAVPGSEYQTEVVESRPESENPTESSKQTEPVKQSEPNKQTDPDPSGTAPTVPESTPTQKPTESQPTQTEDPKPNAPNFRLVDAEYEKWLSAALLIGVSMEYSDFEVEGVYAASATSIADKMDSQGAYIVFTSGGSRIAIQAKPLAEERTAAGTSDLSTETIGFSTFDKVNPASVPFASLVQIPLDDLSTLISQSLLVSIYTR